MTMVKNTSVKKPLKAETKVAAQEAKEKKQIKSTKNTQSITPKVILDTWVSGWKKIFKLDGRSSRFELWVFLLINSILTSIIHIGCNYITSSNYLRTAYANGYSIEEIETHIIVSNTMFYAVMIIAIIPLLSMLIRRIHDVGFLAWKNYLEHTSMSMVTMLMLFLAAIYMEEMEYGINSFLILVAIFVYVFFILSVYATGYHSLKFLITTLFYEGNEEQNKYGKAPAFNTPYYENIALNLSCIYLLFISTMFLLHMTLFLL